MCFSCLTTTPVMEYALSLSVCFSAWQWAGSSVLNLQFIINVYISNVQRCKKQKKKKTHVNFCKIYIDYGYGRICDHICSPMNFSIR